MFLLIWRETLKIQEANRWNNMGTGCFWLWVNQVQEKVPVWENCGSGNNCRCGTWLVSRYRSRVNSQCWTVRVESPQNLQVYEGTGSSREEVIGGWWLPVYSFSPLHEPYQRKRLGQVEWFLVQTTLKSLRYARNFLMRCGCCLYGPTQKPLKMVLLLLGWSESYFVRRSPLKDFSPLYLEQVWMKENITSTHRIVVRTPWSHLWECSRHTPLTMTWIM